MAEASRMVCMKITAIEQQKKNKERFSVFVDGEFAFGVHPDILLDHGLKNGQEIDDQLISAIKTDDSFRVAYDKAIGYLAGRPHSEREVRQYLRDKLIYKLDEYRELADSEAKTQFRSDKESAIEAIITKLQDRKYLDDVAFAKWWITNRREFRPRDKRLLLLELKAKGVSDADITTALTTPSDEGHFQSEKQSELSGASERDSEVQLAMGLAEKQRRKYAGSDERQFRQKMSRFLAGKGFEWEVIDEVITKMKDGAE